MRVYRSFVATVIFGALLLGCQSKPDPTRLHASIEAAPDVNPDAMDRPSPLVLRYYELKSTKTFEGADFFDLYDNAQSVLATEMLNLGEIQVTPGEKKEIDLELNPDTRYVGLIAAYQALDQAQWRATVEVIPTKVKSVAISLDKVAMSVK